MKRYDPRRRLIEFVSDSYKKKFIASNLNYIDLDETYKKAVQNKFRADTGKYLSEETYHYNWTIQSFGFSYDMRDTYENLLKAYNAFIGQTSGNEAEEKYRLDWITSSFPRFLSPNVIKISHRYNMSNIDAVVYLLDYVVNGRLEKDLKRTHDIIENNGYKQYKYALMMPASKFPELGNCTITMLKNGKYIIKGLTPDQYKEIERIINLIMAK